MSEEILSPKIDFDKTLKGVAQGYITSMIDGVCNTVLEAHGITLNPHETRLFQQEMFSWLRNSDVLYDVSGKRASVGQLVAFLYKGKPVPNDVDFLDAVTALQVKVGVRKWDMVEDEIKRAVLEEFTQTYPKFEASDFFVQEFWDLVARERTPEQDRLAAASEPSLSPKVIDALAGEYEAAAKAFQNKSGGIHAEETVWRLSEELTKQFKDAISPKVEKDFVDQMRQFAARSGTLSEEQKAQIREAIRHDMVYDDRLGAQLDHYVQGAILTRLIPALKEPRFTDVEGPITTMLKEHKELGASRLREEFLQLCPGAKATFSQLCEGMDKHINEQFSKLFTEITGMKADRPHGS